MPEALSIEYSELMPPDEALPVGELASRLKAWNFPGHGGLRVLHGNRSGPPLLATTHALSDPRRSFPFFGDGLLAKTPESGLLLSGIFCVDVLSRSMCYVPHANMGKTPFAVDAHQNPEPLVIRSTALPLADALLAAGFSLWQGGFRSDLSRPPLEFTRETTLQQLLAASGRT